MNLFKKAQKKHKHDSIVTEDITPLLLLQDLKIQFAQAYYLENFAICREKKKNNLFLEDYLVQLQLSLGKSYLAGCLPSDEVTTTNSTETKRAMTQRLTPYPKLALRLTQENTLQEAGLF